MAALPCARAPRPVELLDVSGFVSCVILRWLLPFEGERGTILGVRRISRLHTTAHRSGLSV